MIYSKVLLTAIAATAFTAATHAAPVIYEGFDYDSSGLVQGNSGAAGTTGNWSGDNRVDVVSPTLTYGDLQTSGNAAQYIGTGGGGGNLGININGDLATAGLLNDSTTLWFSILMNFVDGPNDETAFALGTAEPFTNNLQGGNGVGFYVDGSSNVRAALYDGGTLQSHTGTANFQGTTQLIVGEINWGIDGSTADTLTLYAPGTDLDITGTSFSTVSADITQSGLSRIGIWARNGDSDSYDEIRFGATLADVTPTNIPEPASLATGLFGMTLIAVRRRR